MPDHFNAPPAIRFFRDSPEAGHPDCLCSLCGQRIPGPDDFEDADDYCPPIRMWDRAGREARFHPRPCFTDVLPHLRESTWLQASTDGLPTTLISIERE